MMAKLGLNLWKSSNSQQTTTTDMDWIGMQESRVDLSTLPLLTVHGLDEMGQHPDIWDDQRRIGIWLLVILLAVLAIWFLSRKKMNRNAHATNGNTVPATFVNITAVCRNFGYNLRNKKKMVRKWGTLQRNGHVKQFMKKVVDPATRCTLRMGRGGDYFHPDAARYIVKNLNRLGYIKCTFNQAIEQCAFGNLSRNAETSSARVGAKWVNMTMLFQLLASVVVSALSWETVRNQPTIKAIVDKKKPPPVEVFAGDDFLPGTYFHPLIANAILTKLSAAGTLFCSMTLLLFLFCFKTLESAMTNYLDVGFYLFDNYYDQLHCFVNRVSRGDRKGWTISALEARELGWDRDYDSCIVAEYLKSCQELSNTKLNSKQFQIVQNEVRALLKKKQRQVLDEKSNKKSNPKRTKKQLAKTNKKRTKKKISDSNEKRTASRKKQRDEDRANWGNACFDVHCSDVLTDEMITQSIEAPASHINHALLKQARAKFIPLSEQDEEGEHILKRSYATAKQKVKATLRWIGFMKEARQFEVCAICGMFGSKKCNGFVEKKLSELHFYKLQPESTGCPYRSWERQYRKALHDGNKKDQRKYQRRMDLLNLVPVGDDLYQFYDAGVQRSSNSVVSASCCGFCLTGLNDVKKAYGKSTKRCVLIPDLKKRREFNQYVALCAPRNSVTHWDVGKDPVKEGILPALSVPERIALQRQIVIGNVFKVHPRAGDTDPTAQTKLRSHFIALPTDASEVVSSLVTNKLPRQDIAKHYSLLFMGGKNQMKLADMLNQKNMSFDFFKVKKWLNYLVDVNPLYERYAIAETPEEVNWEEQKKAIFETDVIYGDDKISMALEKKAQSDVAGGWQSSTVTKGSVTTDSLVQSVMLTQHTGYVDLTKPVLSAVEKQLYPAEEKDGDDSVKKQLFPNEEKDGDDSVVEVHMTGPRTNEFFDNHTLLAGAFPYLFPLGITAKQMGTRGFMQKQVVKRLLCLCDERFATCSDFLFLLMNQKLRHDTVRQINFRLDKKSSMVKKFLELVNAPDFAGRLKYAVLHPKLKSSKKLYRELMPLIKLTGGRVKWTALERQQSVSHLYAMAESLGAPYLFITFSPKVIENELCLRFAVFQNGLEKELLTLKLNGQIAERGLLLSDNPVAAARAFQLMVEAFMDIFVGKPIAGFMRKSVIGEPGLFGPVSGCYGVHEVQGRGILHIHCLLFGHLDPTHISKLADNPELKQLFCDVIDSIVCGSLGDHGDIREEAERVRALKQKVWQAHRAHMRAQYGKSAPSDTGVPLEDILPPNHNQQVPIGLQSPVDPSEIVADIVEDFVFQEDEGRPWWKIICFMDGDAICECVDDPEAPNKNFTIEEIDALHQLGYINKGGLEIASQFNHHFHTRRCHKNKDKTKRYVCQMARPARRSPETKLIQILGSNSADGNLVVVEQSPPGHIDPLPQATSGNPMEPRDDRAVALVLRGDQEADGLQVETSLPMSNVLRCNVAVVPLGALSAALNALHYLTNYFSKRVYELANTLALIRTAQVSAVKFPSKADDMDEPDRKGKFLLNKILNRLSGSVEISDTQAAMSLLDNSSFVSTHHFWYVFAWAALEFQKTLHSVVGNDASVSVHADDVSSADDSEQSEDDDPRLFVDVDADPETHATGGPRPYKKKDGTFVTVYQHDHYRWRGEAKDSPLMFLNLKEYCELTRVVPRGDEKTGTAAKGGRRLNGRYNFHRDHPLHETHVQLVRSSTVMGLLAGHPHPRYPGPMPDPSGGEEQEEEYTTWLIKADYFARYVGTLICPWDFDGKCKVFDWNTLTTYINQLKNPEYELRYFIKAERLQYFQRLGTKLSVSKPTRSVLSKYRFALAKRFSNVDIAKMGNVVGDGMGPAAERERIALAETLDAIQAEADLGIAAFTDNITRERQCRTHEIEETHEKLFPSSDSAPTSTKDVEDFKHIAPWSTMAQTHDKKWVDATRQEMLEPLPLEPDECCSNEGTVKSDAQKDFHNMLLYTGLNAEKKHLLKTVIKQLDSGEQLRLLIHGPPGVGKTYLANLIQRAAKFRGISSRCTAYSGVAASLLNGVTTHHIVGMGVGDEYRHEFDRALIEKIRLRSKGSRLLIIDEASMLSPEMFAALDERFKLLEKDGSKNSQLPFGGRHVILMGDFFQIPPPGHGAKSLYTNLVDFCFQKKLTPECITSAQLFSTFRRLEMKEQY